MTTSLLSSNTSLVTPIELQQTPFFPQQKYQCGPAALATVLNTYDHKTQPDELTDKVYIPEKQGSVAIEMVATARSYDRLVYPLDRNLKDLLKEIEAGHPVLVMQNLAFNWRPQWHYAVVVGYDLDKKSIILRSGTEKRHIMPLKTFERTWSRANYWALVIVPPTQVPATARAPRYLKAAQDLEATGHAVSAVQAYQAAIQHWPDESLPWLALGNAYYKQQDFVGSDDTFRQALQLHPQAAQLWNNLAYSLLAQSCRKQAIEAVQCAIDQQPDNAEYRHSLTEIVSDNTRNSHQCAPIRCQLSPAN